MIALVRPDTDHVTEWTYRWAEKIIGAMEEQRLPYIDLAGHKATRARVEKEIKAHKIREVIFCDHGSSYTLRGQEFSDFHKSWLSVIDPRNIDSLELDFIYAMACNSGRGLGLYATERGYVRSYVGFDGPISFPVEYSEYCEKLLDAITSGILAMILSGATAGAAVTTIVEQLEITYQVLLDQVRSATDAQEFFGKLTAAACFKDVKGYARVDGDPDYTLL